MAPNAIRAGGNIAPAGASGKGRWCPPFSVAPAPSVLDLLDHVLDDARDIPWACALLDALEPQRLHPHPTPLEGTHV